MAFTLNVLFLFLIGDSQHLSILAQYSGYEKKNLIVIILAKQSYRYHRTEQSSLLLFLCLSR